MEGGSLRDWLKRHGPCDIATAKRIVRGIGSALAHAHDRQVLHCDIKPENILVFDDHPYVADFGIARAIHTEMYEWGRPTSLDSSAGTPAYVSPEQASGERNLDARSDIYSLACMVYEMLTGRPPFRGRSAMETVAQRFVEPFPDVRREVPHLPPNVNRVLARAAALDPDHRFADLKAFIAAFEQTNERVHPVVRTAGSLVSNVRRRGHAFLAHDRMRKVVRVVENVTQDLRFAFRSLRRQPMFAAIVVLTLALGIGANTAIFSIINGVLLKPLPYESSDRIVFLGVQGSRANLSSMSLPEMDDVQELPAFEQVLGYTSSSLSFATASAPVFIQGARVTAGLLGVFGLQPALGRDLTRVDNLSGGPRLVVLGNRFWVREFGGDPDIVGRAISLGEFDYEVIGVAPPGFEYPNETEVWIPHRTDLENCARGCRTFNAIGRLEANSEIIQARAQLTSLSSRLSEEYPQINNDVTFEGDLLQRYLVRNVRTGLWVVLGAVGVVLLIACANVAILLLVRANARQTEISIRSALGASRGRIFRQVLVEAQVLALTGATLGVLGAAGAVHLVRELSAETIPRMELVGLDPIVLLVTLSATISVALLFGLAPATALLRTAKDGGMQMAGRSDGQRPADSRMRSVLLTVEAALTVVLLTGSGLLLKTFVELNSVRLGYETENIVRFTVTVPTARYDTLPRVAAFFDEVNERIGALPGVAANGASWGVPLGTGRIVGAVLVEGRPEPEAADITTGSIRSVTPGFLEAMRVSPVRGRTIAASDRSDAVPVALVNETFVRENFPDEDPIGKRFRMTASYGWANPIWTIIGILPDTRTREVTSEPEAELYVPQAQFGPSTMSIVARAEPGSPSLIPLMRDVVRAVDPNLPLRDIETVRDAVGRDLAPTRFYLFLVAVFGVLATLLSAIGLYGVVAYLVSRRRREIGIRLALGEKRESIVRLVSLQGLKPAVVGIVVGGAVAYGASRILESLLYEVNPRDTTVLVGAVVLVLLITAVAAWLPGRRAAHIDPARVMRTE